MTSTYVIADPSAEDTRSADTGAPMKKQAGGRDGFLDVLRAIALTRVIVWHTFGIAFLSWIVATMPIMFFVAGTLLYRSLDGRDPVVVLRKRLRRLLVPFWFFGATVLAAVSFVHMTNPSSATQLRAGQLFAWIFPLVNPTASSWEAGWASAPLWYLRCYLWILLLSPLLLKGWKRFGYRLLVFPAVVTVLVQIVADRIAPGPNDLIWILGDLSLYSIFVLLGFANAQGRFDAMKQRDLLEWAFVGAAGAAVAWRVFPSADGVANHSYPTLLWLGIAWLAAITMLRPWLSQAPDVPVVGTVVRWMTARAMSVYLWHSPVIVFSYALTNWMGVDASPILLLSLIVAGVVIISTATGWIEDVAGGRPAQLWPGRPMFSAPSTMRLTFRNPGVRTALGGFVAATILLGLVVRPSGLIAEPDDAAASEGGLALPPAPSGRPDPTAAVTTDDAPAALTMTVAADDAGLTALVDAWRAENDVAGVVIGVSRPDGERQYIVSGEGEDGEAMSPSQIVPVTSITKTVTAAIILQMRDEGLLDLDDAIPGLDADSTFAHSGVITYRQLLDHSSGLAPYQESVGYDATAALDPITAIQLAGDTPLQWQPGAVGGYSNSGFLTLGRLIEQLTGESYADAVQRRVIGPLALSGTALDTTPVGGWVGDSAGGLNSTVDDLLTWGSALYRDGSVLSPQSLADMTAIDPNLASGLGTFPVCPCTDNENGTLNATSIGHNGGSVTMQFSEADSTVIVASFSESFWTNELSQADMYPLLEAIRAAVA